MLLMSRCAHSKALHLEHETFSTRFPFSLTRFSRTGLFDPVLRSESGSSTLQTPTPSYSSATA